MKYSFTRRWGFARFGTFVVSYTAEPPLFSERMGFKKPIFRIGKYRVLYWRNID